MSRNLLFIALALLLGVITLDTQAGFPVSDDSGTQIYGACCLTRCLLKPGSTCDGTSACATKKDQEDEDGGNQACKAQSGNCKAGASCGGIWLVPCGA